MFLALEFFLKSSYYKTRLKQISKTVAQDFKTGLIDFKIVLFDFKIGLIDFGRCVLSISWDMCTFKEKTFCPQCPINCVLKYCFESSWKGDW